MGNYISNRKLNPGGKVILSDSRVHEFNEPVTAAELMLEHPQQVVVEFKSLFAGEKPIPLPADKKLDTEKIYVMLHMKRGKVAPLSTDEAHRILLQVKPPQLRSGSFSSLAKVLHLFPWKSRVSIGHKEVLPSYGLARKEVANDEKLELLQEVFHEKSEFLSKQFSGKGWKPNLDTIKEKRIEKVPHSLF